MFGHSRILNCDVLRVRREDLLLRLRSGVLVTPNLDHLIHLQHDREFYECYTKADWCICDSHYLWLSSFLVGQPLPETISGADFFTEYYLYHKDDPDCRIFLLGAKEGVAATAREKINAKVGREIVIGAHSPSFGFEKKPEEIDDIVDIVNRSGANVVLVGVGAPKQEKFIMRYKERMPGVKLWMALGATIDFEAGNVKRAPRWVQRCALEWLYRIYCEPKRMFKRYICDDLIFFWYLFKQVLGIYKNPFEEATN